MTRSIVFFITQILTNFGVYKGDFEYPIGSTNSIRLRIWTIEDTSEFSKGVPTSPPWGLHGTPVPSHILLVTTCF